jgi:hypothetical protein
MKAPLVRNRDSFKKMTKCGYIHRAGVFLLVVLPG